ncbi:unnamed protein product, partial [Timema podura]|nr:unnamed protein product [Timema podura]
MVKVNEKPEEKSPKHQDFGPQSSFSNDGSFVVLEESSVEGMTAQVDIMVKVNEKPEENSPKHQDFGPQSSFSNDGSFVVLEESSVEGMTAQLPNSHLPPSLTFDGLPSVGNSTLGPSNTNGQGACYMSTSMTTDLNPEEIQNKLHELLVENVELKGM